MSDPHDPKRLACGKCSSVWAKSGNRVTGRNPAAVLHGPGFCCKRLRKQKLVVPEE